MHRYYLSVAAVALILVVAMCACALATGDVIEETKALLKMPWGRFVLADVLASFLLLSLFVQMIERRIWLSVALFIVAAVALGSMTYAIWILLRCRVVFERMGLDSGQ